MYHAYPYKAQIPIAIDGKYQTRTFESKEDVDAVIELLIDEVKQTNKEGNNFNIAQSIVKQLPFFACPNVLVDKNSLKDISRYIYSTEFGVSPYQGSYGEQPHRWVEKSFLIKNIIGRKKAETINHGG